MKDYLFTSIELNKSMMFCSESFDFNAIAESTNFNFSTIETPWKK